MNGPFLLEGRHLTKQFGDLLALDKVDISVAPKQIHVVLGENGAGKSTLMKILYGVYRPDGGSCFVLDRPAHLYPPANARAHGIGMVFQDFRLIPALTVMENIALALPDLEARIRPKDLRQRILKVAERYGLAVDPDVPVWQLDVGQRQRVEIVKVLLVPGTRVLIFDEPTSVLAATEVDAFLEILRRLRDEGYGILFITHKLREALACADRITVMRAGKVVHSSEAVESMDEQGLVAHMVGEWVAPVVSSRTHATTKKVALEVQNLSLSDDCGRVILRDISLTLNPGKILGVAGISGNGQRELSEALLGLRPVLKGRIIIIGENLTGRPPAAYLESGVACIPENPLEDALIPGLSILQHMILGGLPERRRGLGIDWEAVKQDMAGFSEIAKLKVAPPERRVDRLSGGNVQRMIIARALVRSPKILVACYPSRGLDIGTTRFIQRILLERREAGAAVILFSEDLTELFEISDEIVVISHGRLIGPLKPENTDAYNVAKLMVEDETA